MNDHHVVQIVAWSLYTSAVIAWVRRAVRDWKDPEDNHAVTAVTAAVFTVVSIMAAVLLAVFL